MQRINGACILYFAESIAKGSFQERFIVWDWHCPMGSLNVSLYLCYDEYSEACTFLVNISGSRREYVQANVMSMVRSARNLYGDE